MLFPSELYDHTFSITGRDERTGVLGVCVQTSAIAVGSRCPYVKAHVGALCSQSLTNPRFGPLALHLMESGYTAPKVVQELEASDPYIEHRQVGIVDRDGHSAARTGSRASQWAGHLTGKNYAAIGNGLVGPQVLEAMAKAFLDSEGEELEERLLRGIEAGQGAGGENEDHLTDVNSAALLVYDHDVFSRVDLRVDDHPKVTEELRRLFELYKPRIRYLQLRAVDPEAAQALSRGWVSARPTRTESLRLK